MSIERPVQQPEVYENEGITPGWPVIITDLDGCLLRHDNYSFQEAQPALRKARKIGVPIVIVSSKTNAEITELQREMHLYQIEPYIFENGAGIKIPKSTFSLTSIQNGLNRHREEGDNAFQNVLMLDDNEKDGFYTIMLGTPIEEARSALRFAAGKADIGIVTSADMSVEQFAQFTGLSSKRAALAKQRVAQEVFNPLEGSREEALKRIMPFLDERYVLQIGGRFCQIMGKNATKGSGVTVLNSILKEKYGTISTIGLGDAKSDFPFLVLCDVSFLIHNPNAQLGDIPPDVLSRVIHVAAEGPVGWNMAVGMELRNAQRRKYFRQHVKPYKTSTLSKT